MVGGGHGAVVAGGAAAWERRGQGHTATQATREERERGVGGMSTGNRRGV